MQAELVLVVAAEGTRWVVGASRAERAPGDFDPGRMVPLSVGMLAQQRCERLPSCPVCFSYGFEEGL
jgi:hypothetical protein